jgi:hypothetical protein
LSLAACAPLGFVISESGAPVKESHFPLQEVVPTDNPSADPTTEPTPEPTSEPTPEPSPEPDPESTPDPDPESTPDPGSEPTSEPEQPEESTYVFGTPLAQTEVVDDSFFDNAFAGLSGCGELFLVLLFQGLCVVSGSICLGVHIIDFLLTILDHLHHRLPEKLLTHEEYQKEIQQGKQGSPGIYANKALKFWHVFRSFLRIFSKKKGLCCEQDQERNQQSVDTGGLSNGAAQNHVGTQVTGSLRLTGHALQSLTDSVAFTDSGADSADTHTQTGTDCSSSSHKKLIEFHKIVLLK